MATSDLSAVIVYTCIAGQYDDLVPPAYAGPFVKFVCFSNVKFKNPGLWEVIPIPSNWGKGRDANRYAKMHPHVLFPNNDISLYVDGNIKIRANVTNFISNALDEASMAIYQHPYRDCIYDEAKECSDIGHDWLWRIRRQLSKYAAWGFPLKGGLYECNILVRRHLDKNIQTLMSAWWSEYLTGVRRDQIALPVLAWKLNVKITSLGPSDARFDKKVFEISPHQDHAIPFIRKVRGAINRRISNITEVKTSL